MTKKIVFFGSSNSFITSILFKAFLSKLPKNFELVAVVNTTPNVQINKYKKFFNFIMKKIFNFRNKNIVMNSYTSFLSQIPKDLLINCEDINSDKFIDKIKIMNPQYCFVMGCPQIFKQELIQCFDKVINYHNSFLPTYRGLNATSWQMTHKEKYTGYTFHFINENIDDGQILFQEKMEIDYTKSSFGNEVMKTYFAANKIEKLFSLMQSDFEGYEQEGISSYYGKKEQYLLLYPTTVDILEYRRLIDIWGYIVINEKKVTSIDKNGIIHRINYIPVWLYTLLQKVGLIK